MGEKLNKLNPKIAFIIEFASALHRCGTPSDQLENVLSMISKHLGLKGEFFSTPTYMMICFKADDDDFNHMRRLEPAAYDINRRQMIDEIGEKVFKNELSVGDAKTQILDVMSAGTLYPIWYRILAHALLSAAFAFLVDGSVLNIGLAGGTGLLVGLIEYASFKSGRYNLLLITASFSVGLFAHLLHLYIPMLDPRLIILSGTIALVPGLTLTMSISELANTHLASGTARLMSAMVTLLKILFGVVFATKLVSYFAYIDLTPRTVSYSLLAKLIPLSLFTLGKGILLNMKASDFKWVFMSCVCTFYVTAYGVEFLGQEAGVFLGALTVSTIANNWGNIFKRSPQVFLIPGIFLLVPGRMAYESITYFYDKNIISGINTGFNVLIVCISIVIGLLVGNTFVNTDKRYKPTA